MNWLKTITYPGCDKGARETDTSIIPLNGACAGENRNAGLRRIGEPDLFECGECRLVDPLDLGRGQDIELPAFETRSNGPHVIGGFRRAQGMARRAAARAAGSFGLV